MRMLLWVLALCLLPLSVRVFAQDKVLMDAGQFDARERKAASMPSEWFLCAHTAECGLVSVPCLPSLAVRADKISEAQAAICQSHDDNCPPACDASVQDTSSALCNHGQCSTVFGPRGQKYK